MFSFICIYEPIGMPTAVFTECIALYINHLVYWWKNDIIITCSQQIDIGSDVYWTNLPSSCVFRLRLKKVSSYHDSQIDTSFFTGGFSGETQHFTLLSMSSSVWILI